MLTGFCALVLSLLIFWEIMDMKKAPAGFPFLVGILLAGAGSALAAKNIWLKKEAGKALFSGLSFRQMVFPFGLWIAMALMMEYVGLFLCTTIFLFLVMWYLDGFPLKALRLGRYAVITLALVAVLWLIFDQYLEMYLPGGVWFE